MTSEAVNLDSPLAAKFEQYFTIKTSADVAGTMAYFSPDLVTYTDATLGWALNGYDAVRIMFEQYMPSWEPPAASYTTGVLSNRTSALVHMTDTPELFGGELRALAAVDFVDGRIVRWIDYWDGASFDGALYEKLRTPAERFPHDLRESEVATGAAPELVSVATKLQTAFSGGTADGAGKLFHADVVLRDMSLRSCQVGRIEGERYLARVLGTVPYGRGSTLRHVVGGTGGGGFEWTSAAGLVGITAIELDDDGAITSVASVYDSRQVRADQKAALVAASVAP